MENTESTNCSTCGSEDPDFIPMDWLVSVSAGSQPEPCPNVEFHKYPWVTRAKAYFTSKESMT